MTNIRPLALIFAVSLSAAFASPQSDCGSALCELVASGTLSSLRWPDFSGYKVQVQTFYEPTGYAPAWIDGGKVTSQAKALIEILKGADAKGLNFEDYDGSRWSDRLAQLQIATNPKVESTVAEFDLALTISAMRYISDLHFGRVNPGLFHTSPSGKHEKLNLPSFLRQRVIYAKDVKAGLEEIEPPYEGYRRAQRALQQYMTLAREDQIASLPITKKTVEPGSSYDRIAQLTSLLRQMGDLPSDAKLSLDSNKYDARLVDAVKHFQLRHGLEQDGRLGVATVAQLNIPLNQRVRQLQLTLERWRWIPDTFPRPPIVVNIPEFVLRAVGDQYRTELGMKVVVGKAYHHQTPVFAAELKRVVFRPYWNVPLSIQRAELVPKIAEDSAYLMKNHYEVVTPQNTVVTNGIVDPTILAQLRSGKLRIRQIPGPENALGLIAFMFPNEHDVYLHSTPATELFSKSRRDFSHGCIRAEKPQQLAEWVLRNQLPWTSERIAEAMNGTKTLQVNLDRPIPVLIVYATAVVLESGEVRFFEDIYGLDAQLSAALANGPSHASKAETRMQVSPQ
jgi:L,D-transpeptidase YcbB